MKKMDFENGKYTLVLGDDGYTVTALRHGEPWRDFVGDSFISYLAQAVFEKEQAPTDDEREALVREVSLAHAEAWSDERECAEAPDRIADAILAAGFRRPAQTEPTDAQVIAAMTDPNRITDEQADAAQLAHYRFVFGEEGLPNQRELGIGRQAMKVAISEAVRAAFTAGQEEQS